jgi:hypothetical protein
VTTGTDSDDGVDAGAAPGAGPESGVGGGSVAGADPVPRGPGPHPRPTSRRGRADVRRRTPPPTPAYTGATTDGWRRRSAAAPTNGTPRGVPTDHDDVAAAPADHRAEGRPPDADGIPPAPAQPIPPRLRAADVRRRRTVLLATIGALTAAGIVLAVVGLANVRTSTVGRFEDAASPSDPGYQAYVVPTPTMGVLHRSSDGTLAGAALLALEPGDEGGSVIVVPPSTIVSGADTTTTIADVYRDEGSAAAAEALGMAVAVGVADHVEIDDVQWTRLVTPVGDVEITLDQEVGEWPAGSVSLEADEVGRFLATRSAAETDLDRVERQQVFWNAWLPLVGEEGDSALPGEVGTGIGRFVLGVARGGASAAELPVRRAEVGDEVLFRPDADRLGEFVSRTVPYPVGATAGGRVRVRLLNGTDDPDLSTAAARALVAAGAQISIVGNAPSFDVADTRLVYFGEDRAPLADWLQMNLGGGRVEETPNGQDGQVSSDDEIDVTVILGQDAGDLIGEVEDP